MFEQPKPVNCLTSISQPLESIELGRPLGALHRIHSRRWVWLVFASLWLKFSPFPKQVGMGFGNEVKLGRFAGFGK